MTSRQRQRGQVHDQVHVDMYFKEISKKEDSLMMEAMRRQFDNSNNGILRAMTSHNLMSSMGRNGHDSLQFQQSMTMSAKLRNSLVDGGDRTLLTRGSLPSSIPAKYDSFPDDQDWNKAEVRYRELEKEMKEIDIEIEEKKREVASNRQLMGGAAIDNLKPKPGSHVLGSAFKWKSEGTSNGSTYVWHKSKLSPTKSANGVDDTSGRNSANQYGFSTKSCDLPEGNILINPNALKKFKGTLAPPKSASVGRRSRG